MILSRRPESAPPADMTALALFHDEGPLAEATLASLQATIATAQAGGLVVAPLIVLDRPTMETRLLVEARAVEMGARILSCDFGDQALARNHGIFTTETPLVALLDGDDLWAPDWLLKAKDALARAPSRRSIAHPQYNWIFGDESLLMAQPDLVHSDHPLDALRFTNAWDALCVAPREAWLECPYLPRDTKAGWGYEDWHWNMETTAAGWAHLVVPQTVIFKRRHARSRMKTDLQAGVVCRASGLHRWDAELYHSGRGEVINNSPSGRGQ